MSFISALISFMSRFIFDRPDWTNTDQGPHLRGEIQERCRDSCN